MPIPERTLSRWSHHQAAKAFTQAQGSYRNDTSLGGASDVDLGPPPLTVDSAIFEMWLGSLSRYQGLAIPVV